jgi:fatty acid desaturase
MASETINWYRTPIPRETLRELTQKSNLKGWLQAGSFLLIWLVLTAAAFWFFRARLWVPMVILCYAQSLFMNMMSMSAAVHELSHGTPFKSKPVNEFFMYLFCFLTWNNPVHFRISHIANHHQYTVYVGLDKEVIQVPVKDKLNWVNIVSWCIFDFKWFATFIRTNVLHALGNTDVDFFSWDPLLPRDDPRRKQIAAWARFMVIAYIVLLAVFIYFHLWVLIYLVIFSSFSVRILANLTGAIQHTGLGQNIPDWRMVCHTVKVNPLIGYLYWNMNYHTEHHMYAAVPFCNLKKLRKVLEPDVPVAHKSFSACFRALSQIRKRQDKDPGWFFVPALPPTAAPARMS